MKQGIYLIGFSGTGKSTVAKLIGAKLNWPSYDLDDVIVEQSGMTIPLIFEREGEPGFRSREAEALRLVSSSGHFVVATGGGTPVRAENRQYMASKGWIICLEGRPEIILARIQRQLKESDPTAIRPMLDAVYPLDQVRALKNARQSLYALSDWTVHTDRMTSEQVADEVIRAAEVLAKAPDITSMLDAQALQMRHSLTPDLPPPIAVTGGPWPYQAIVGWNHLHSLGDQLRRILPQARTIAVLTETNAWDRLGAMVQDSLQGAGFKLHIRKMRQDERQKSTDEASAIYDWLLEVRLRRNDVIVVVGGGAIDDLGGFVASTYMRGVPLVKVPTTLESMVDTSIGGKTALNHPGARNLIGTFFHPRLAYADASLLLDEEPRQLRSAWAEVVKYGMLESTLLRDQPRGDTLFGELEKRVDELIALERPVLLKVITRCLALKAQVVSGDERDSGQHRIFLNYGHTVAHALETATNYELPHGEAVSIGMAVEARLAVRLGMADASVETRQNELLSRFGLPTRIPPVSHPYLLELIHRDKKVFGDSPRWILPVAIGRAVVSGNVSEADLISVLKERTSD